jgi:Icc-related predicted phosphoesterase
MRMVLTSDLHGDLPTVPPCDALLVAGDLCPISDHDPAFQARWLRDEFVPWLAATPARMRLFVAGNHDFVFGYAPHLLAGVEWPGTYLQDAGFTWEGVAFWGSPWATDLPGWPFTAPEEQLAGHFAKIDPATRVLVVHGPPFGYGDGVERRGRSDPLPVGSKSLLSAIEELPELRLVVYGHIHEGVGIYRNGGVTLMNVARMDREYRPTNPLRVFDLEA